MHLKILVSVLFFLSLTAAAPAYGMPQGFADYTVFAGLSLPTDFAFAQDGRIFIAQKNGAVVIFKDGTIISPPALEMAVIAGGDRGLLGVALDPDFSINNYIYLFYTSSSNHQRISRFVVSGDSIPPSSEIILLENPRASSGFLNAGTIRFGPDGKLYATFGSDGLGSITQDLSALEGKLIRINSDGTIPSNNPFFVTTGAQKSIYAYGFRNPWRFNFDATGNAIVGDVGEDDFEKIVRVVSGANFGWPNFEGDCRPNCGGITPPLYSYPHSADGGAAVVGGVIEAGSTFPGDYANSYFFGDYVGGYIKNMVFDSLGNVAGISDFAQGIGAVAGMHMGLDGCLYYLVIFPGELRKICYNAPESISVTASSNSAYGSLPLAVQFNAQGMGSNLLYHWDFGDGENSSEQNPFHIYTKQGVYQSRVTVTNSTESKTATVTIWAGYLPPEVTLTAPESDKTWKAGDSVFFQASAIDPLDGFIPQNNFVWKIIFHHNTHIHAPEEIIGQSSGIFEIPNHIHTEAVDLGYEFQVTVVNSVGLSTTVSRMIYPNLMRFTLTSNPVGLQILLDDQPTATPHELYAIPGYARKISASSPQTVNGIIYNLSSWSTGGPYTQVFVMPPFNTEITANFIPRNDSEFVVGVSLPKENYATLETISGNTLIRGNISGEIIADIEIWDTVKRRQHAISTSVIAAEDEILPFSIEAPSSPGNYIVKIGIFSSDWGFLYHWNDNVYTFTVGGEAKIPLEFRAEVTANKTDYTAGEPISIVSVVQATQGIPELIIDMELWRDGDKIDQKVVLGSLGAYQDLSSQWDIAALPVGVYVIKIGLFTLDWLTLHLWIDNAATINITDPGVPPVAPLAFAVSAVMPDNSFPAGSTGTVTTYVTSTADIINAQVDTEIYDLYGNKVGQNVRTANLTANQQYSSDWNFVLPGEDGTYIIKVGVFSGDWTTIYFWKNNAFQFTIGSAPGSPISGQMYPINVIVPDDGDVVSGVIEIKSRIDALDIHAYNIAWRTGSDYFTLDTDPVTQAFKHAWIDFAAWNWMADNRYPLQFQATDLNGNIIGDRTIFVQVVH